ncbi:putative N terminal glutamine amidase [Trypanosoma vivax]|uniref:Protein N-terminal glutamine amidohydrolase n=1 Tax=Trypanosoma vivax (strain Y486) TaxID=1055687 RepID=G0U6S1_TRYVY|nr:putative N terminal glutamine amidase [Trypanosoma vivax]CCC51575.1 conserved hypothetical protein [Trypanosoma vivax Y486]
MLGSGLQEPTGDVEGGLGTKDEGEETLPWPTREVVPYASYYCEENAYKLIEILSKDHLLLEESVFAVFISNKLKATPLWMQRLCVGDDPVLWDYHVIVLVIGAVGGDSDRSKRRALVFDSDTVLPYPCDALEYVEKSLRPWKSLPSDYEPLLRVVPARDYIAYFSSDRSHMSTATALPPSWPPINGYRAPNRMQLPLYWDMTANLNETTTTVPGLGTVMSLDVFVSLLTSGDAVLCT